MDTKISVIIPVYNGEAFIERAINSILEQTLKPSEIIIVNDGSTDGTAEKLLSFGNKITVIAIPNGGVSNARNVGIKACSGDLIAFLDADDVWYKEKLKTEVNVFEKFPEVGFTCCDYFKINTSTNAKVSYFLKYKTNHNYNFDKPLIKSAFELLIHENFVGTCSNVVFKRALLNQVGFFDTDLKQAEDYAMWIQFSLVTNFVLIDDQLLEKFTHETNLTNNKLETFIYHELVLTKLKANSLAKDQLNKISEGYCQSLAKVRYQIGNLLYESKQKKQAFKYYFMALNSDWSYENFKRFIYFFGRKLIRTISFGIIKNRESRI